jgi:uncharacterized repeat protein (TIGR01451 family)
MSRLRWLLPLASVLTLAAAGPAVADPVWQINAVANTTALPNGTITYYVQPRNVGTSDADGSPIVTTITLPPGLTGISGTGVEGIFGSLPDCSVDVSVIQCTTTNPVPDIVNNNAAASLRYTIVAAVDPDVPIPTTLTATFDVTGGGTSVGATTVDPTRIDTPPGFGVDTFDGRIDADPAGTPFAQAGGHPYGITTAIDFNTVHNPLPLIGDLWPVEPVKDAVVELPPGLVGSTVGVDQCTAAQLATSSGTNARPLCPPTSQIGTTLVRLNGFPAFPIVFGPVPVFNLVPPPGAPAQFGFNVSGTVVTLTARLRSGTDYGLSIDGNDISEGLAIAGTSFTFWGVPSDPTHTPDRACPGEFAPWSGGPTCQSGAPPRAFLRMPTSCAASPGSPVQDGLATNLAIDSWVHPGARDANGDPAAGDPRWQRATWVTHAPPGYPAAPPYGQHSLPTGCDKVPFDPALDFRPAAPTVQANSPTPFTVDLTLPQSDDPSTVGESDLKKAVVTLPEGVRVSPSSADGLGACTPAQIGLHSTADATCPDSSKIATLTIKTPLIEQELTGAVYLAAPHDNPFDSLLAIYLVAKGPGVIVKLAGHVEADPHTGQLTTTIDNSPQTPFSSVHLEFKGGSRAALVTPPQCGTYTTHAALTSWSQPDAPVPSESSFVVNQNSDGTPCAPPGFAPRLNAGSVNPRAGASSPFGLQLTRTDRDQELSAITVDLPTGLLGKIANVVPCPDAAANAGTCQDVSKIGTVTVGAGEGPTPFYIHTGRAYLTSPYKGAPYGLSIVVPAVAGPFDLGNVVVRSKVEVDRRTAQVRVVSEPLPTILQGIPLSVRDVRVIGDKPRFFVNPTSCAPKHVRATVRSTAGATARVSARYQVTNCAALRLAPKLSLTVGARRHTRAGVSTPLTTVLTQTPGQTNLRSVSVALPGILNARLPVIRRACKLAEFEADRCTAQAKVGTVSVVTPLLRDPLRGSAYFVKNPARVLPDLMFALRGPIKLDVAGKVSIPGGKRLATRFDTIPDAPITKLKLRIVSGKNGPIGIVKNLCSANARHAAAAVGFRGQNGALLKVNQRLRIRGCPGSRHRH